MNRRTFMAAVAAALATAAVSLHATAETPAAQPDRGDLGEYRRIVRHIAARHPDVEYWSLRGHTDEPLQPSQVRDWELRLKLQGYEYYGVVYLTLDRPYLVFEHEARGLFYGLEERLDQHCAGIGELLVPDAR